jgi:hypothetical protein
VSTLGDNSSLPQPPVFTPATTPGSELRDQKRERMLRQIEEDGRKRLPLFRRLYSSGGRLAPRLAIKAFCLTCCWMDQRAIRDCTDAACPLWDYRPYRTKKSESVDNP